MKYDPSGYWESIGVKGDSPGHPFRGNQYVDAGGEGTPAPATTQYHGTASPALQGILKDGITPQKQGCSAKWDCPTVYCSPNKTEAERYAKRAATIWMERLSPDLRRSWDERSDDARKVKGCIFEIEVPKEEMGKMNYRPGGFYDTAKIPPAWIVGYESFDYDPETGNASNRQMHRVRKSVGKRLFVPVLFTEEVEDEEGP